MPPVTVRSIAPLLPPKHETACGELLVALKETGGSVTLMVEDEVHPRVSVTVTVYVPAGILVRFCV